MAALGENGAEGRFKRGPLFAVSCAIISIFIEYNDIMAFEYAYPFEYAYCRSEGREQCSIY